MTHLAGDAIAVHRVVDDRITLWKDYWDMGALSTHAPPNWLAGAG